MKIAVYTIAKNEEQFVERWYESAKDADYLLIADTGSTDGTVAKAKALGINVIAINVNPWRFDKARNASLDALPADIKMCIALDMDEVLTPGWREHIESLPKHITRPRYQYTWSWNEDGSPGLVYSGDKIHRRHGYFWKHPVHEVLTDRGLPGGEIQQWVGLEIHHHPDHTKSRSQYLPLLELAVREDPDDDRNAFYYARELFFQKDPRAAAELKRHLGLARATWKPERAASMRYLAQLEDCESWLLRAAAEAPERREVWIDLASYYDRQNNWSACFAAATRALTITEKPLEYLCEAGAWNESAHDLAAVSAYRLGLFDKAVEHGKQALAINPRDERLVSNLHFYERGAHDTGVDS